MQFYFLFSVGFDNKQTSLKVDGGLDGKTLCCWMIYSGTNFQGESLHFRYSTFSKGAYESAQDMGKTFRDASSIQLMHEDCVTPFV